MSSRIYPAYFILILLILMPFTMSLSEVQELESLQQNFTEDLDDCPDFEGNSTVDRVGCLDTDGDGVSDPDDEWDVNDGADPFPTEVTQWRDTDGDGWGDNTGIDAKRIDFWPNNAIKYRANILIGCDPPSFTIEPGVDVAFVCKITNPMPNLYVRVELKWLPESEITSEWDSKIIELAPEGESGDMELVAIYVSAKSLGLSGGELQAWVGEHETPSGIINLPVLVTVSGENPSKELNEELTKSLDLSELHNDIEEVTVIFTENTGIPLPVELFYSCIIMLILSAIRRNRMLKKTR